MSVNIEAWNEYLADIGIGPDYRKDYISFIKSFKKQNLPPIFETNHLALLIGRNTSDMWAMAFAQEKFYRSFQIKKRTGGHRDIVSPYPSLLEVQRWILDNIIDKLRPHRSAKGFIKGSSIVDNARIHCKRNVLLKLDIKDFFPSINFRQVMSVFTSAGYPQNVSFALSRLCTLNGKLPQGAATSPAISNIVCKSMDVRIASLCKKKRLKYSRYADDITISGKNVEQGLRGLIEEIVVESGFRINDAKTRILFEGDKKLVTGLDITSGRPRVGRAFRRDLQRDVFFVWSEGLASPLARRKIFNPRYIDHLAGRIAFWESVEPNSGQVKKIKKRFNIILSTAKMMS